MPENGPNVSHISILRLDLFPYLLLFFSAAVAPPRKRGLGRKIADGNLLSLCVENLNKNGHTKVAMEGLTP